MSGEEMLVEKTEAIEELLARQEPCCVSDYQIGLYNGLAIGLSVLTGEEPKFYEFNKEEEEDGI